MKTASKYYISDAPKIYNVSDIYSEFFGLKTQTIENIPYDGQTHISRGNTYGRMDLKFLVRSANNHMKLFLFNSLMKRDNKDADRIVDIVPKDTIDVVKNTVQSVPHIISSEGKTTLKNNDIYRTLISGQRYIDAEGKLQNLSADFVIRSGQS